MAPYDYRPRKTENFTSLSLGQESDFNKVIQMPDKPKQVILTYPPTQTTKMSSRNRILEKSPSWAKFGTAQKLQTKVSPLRQPLGIPCFAANLINI